MLFILALQHQRNHNSSKENQYGQSQLFKEIIQHQSILLRESLLKEVKRLKRQAKRQESLNYYENESYGNIIDNAEENNTFHIRDDFQVVNHQRHRHHISNHHKRFKSKSNKHLNLLNETKINNELLNNNEIKICPICLDNYKIEDKILYLPCFHFYHSKCIKKWLKCSKICPLCKKEINFNKDNI